MKHCLLLILSFFVLFQVQAQLDNYIHEGKFSKGRIGMSSRHYKPDDWEKPLMDSAIRYAFPSSLVKEPSTFQGKLIHLIGILDSVTVDMQQENSTRITLLLDNKYWDYIEDYSIQDEKMFVSQLGDGKFRVMLSLPGKVTEEQINQIARPNTLFLVYGDFVAITDGLPLIAARQLKYIDYKWYTTKVMNYDIKRDKQGLAITDKSGNLIVTGFKFLKVAGPGQNK